MSRVDFRPSANCTAASFKQLMTAIRSMPEVETIEDVKQVSNPTQSMGMYMAFLYDDADEQAVRKAVASLPEVEWVMNLNDE